jgi:hypothetical protein
VHRSDAADWVRIPLSDDEAFVLSHWVYELQNGSGKLSDEAVWPALYAIDGPFTTSSPLIFAPDYDRRLEDARTRIRAGARGVEQHSLVVGLTADQAVVLADWLRQLDPTDESLRAPLRRIRAAVEANGVSELSLPAARRRLFASMGRDENGQPIEDPPDLRTACGRTRLLLGGGDPSRVPGRPDGA